ncbi:MAG: hypothetical protein ACE5R6_10710 [Candidatus Heimdallarchaeota archaeon]
MSKTDTRTSGLVLIVLGGMLLIYAGSTGSIGVFETIVEYAKNYLGETETTMLEILLIGLGVIASLGGISVLAGAYLIRKDREGTGKFIVGIGAGMGLIGLILLIVTTVMGREGLRGTYQLIAGMATGTSGLGVLLTIFGRMRV